MYVCYYYELYYDISEEDEEEDLMTISFDFWFDDEGNIVDLVQALEYPSTVEFTLCPEKTMELVCELDGVKKEARHGWSDDLIEEFSDIKHKF